MRVRAVVRFAGKVSMAIGEVRDIPDEVAAPLIRDGYLAPAEPEEKKQPAKALERGLRRCKAKSQRPKPLPLRRRHRI